MKNWLRILLLLLVSAQAFGAPTLQQSKFQGCNSCGLATIATTFTVQNVAAGDTLVAIVRWDSTATPTLTSVTDNAGDPSFTLDPIGSTTNGSYIMQMAYLKNAIGGTKPTVTGTVSATNIKLSIVVFDISGTSTTAPYDISRCGSTGFVSSGGSLSSGAMTTTSNGDLILAFAQDQGANAGTLVVGAGYTINFQPGDAVFNSSPTEEDKIQSSAGSVTATFTSSAGFNGTIYLIALVPSAGVASPATTALPKTTVLPKTVVL